MPKPTKVAVKLLPLFFRTTDCIKRRTNMSNFVWWPFCYKIQSKTKNLDKDKTQNEIADKIIFYERE